MMRWLLTLLLLLNIGLFLWTRMHVVPQQSLTPKSIRPPGVQEILLLRETGRQQSTETVFELEQDDIPDTDNPPLYETDEGMAQEVQPVDSVEVAESSDTESAAVLVEAEPEPEPEPEPVCGRIGPYEDAVAAQKYRDKSRRSGISLDMVQTTEQVRNGYWVLIPILPSRQEARQMVTKLEQAGVTDLWLFTKGPMANSISLGLYVGVKNATRHSNNINKKGFNSKVSPKMSEQTRYWLNYKTVDEQALADWIAELSADLQNEKKACE